MRAMARYLGWQHRPIHRVNGVLIKGCLVGAQVSAHRLRFGNSSGTVLRRISRCHSHFPVVVGDTRLPPTRIQPGDDFDSTLAWRFQHRATKVGTRIESTAFAGLVVPGPQSAFNGMAHTTSNVPGFMVGAVTGRASLSHYVWLGATFTKFAEHNGNKRPDVFDYSLVYGYRPPKWRRTPDKWDWRLFGELVGERSNRFLQANTTVAEHASAPSLSRPVSTWNLSQLHSQLRCTVPDLSGRRARVAERTRAFRGQFQLSAVPAFTLGDEMKKAIALFSTFLLLVASASAEIKSIDITIFGMD